MKKLLLLVFLILAAAPLYAQNNTLLSPVPKQQFFDSNGNPLAGGRLYSYTAGTTTPKATYTDSTGMTANANPAILDSAGRVNVWLTTGFYKLVLTSAAGVNIWTVDNIPGFGESDLAICGADGEVIFNRMGLCGHDPDFTFDTSNNQLTAGNGVNIAGTTDGLILINTLSSAGTWTFTLPPNDGSTNQVLTTDGNGVTTWQTFTASGCDISGTLTTQIIFNSVGSCAGDAGLTYTAATNALNLQGTTSGDALSIRAHASTDAWTLIFPADAGTTAQVLTSHGGAGTTWDTPDCILGSGQNTQVIYNNSGDCGSSSAFTFNSGTNLLTVPSIKHPGSTNGSVTILASATGADWTLTLPNSDGNSGQFLQTDGAGVTTWATAGDGCLTGSSNTQILFNDAGTCAGDAGLTYTKATNTINLGGTTSGFAAIKAPAIAGSPTLTTGLVTGTIMVDFFDQSSASTITTLMHATGESVDGSFWKVGEHANTLALGYRAGESMTEDTYHSTFIGGTAGQKNLDGFWLTLVGHGAGFETTSGDYSAFIGTDAGHYVTNPQYDTYVGNDAGHHALGDYNTFVGANSGVSTSPYTGSRNEFFGYKAGQVLSSGNNNILIGYQAANTLTTGSGNIVICHDCDTTAATTSSQLKIGDLLLGDMTGVLATATLQVNGGIVMPGTSGSITMRAPATTTTWALTLPTIDGDSGQFLQTDGAGVTTWAAPSGCDISGTSTTQVIYNLTGACAGDAQLTYDGTNNTLLVGTSGGGQLKTLIDDNKLSSFYNRTSANESEPAVDFQVQTTGANVDGIGLRVEIFHDDTGALSSLTGAIMLVEDSSSTSGTQSFIGFKSEVDIDDNAAGHLSLLRGGWIQVDSSREGNGTGQVWGLHLEVHTSTSDEAFARVVGLIIDSGDQSHNVGLGEYDGIYVGVSTLSGIVTDSFGVKVDGQGGSATITKVVGVGIENQSFTGVTTSYGLKIEDQDDDCTSCAGANWAIYTGDEGIIRFGGLSTASGTPNSICQVDATKEITVNAALTCTVSARDQKNSIAPLEMPALALIHELLPVSFKYNDKDRLRYGFIAEDVAAVDPRFGDGWKGDDARSIDMPALLAVSVKAIQELEDRVRQLEAR